MKRKQSASVRGRRDAQHLEAFRLCCRCASASGMINAAYPSSEEEQPLSFVTSPPPCKLLARCVVAPFPLFLICLELLALVPLAWPWLSKAPPALIAAFHHAVLLADCLFDS